MSFVERRKEFRPETGEAPFHLNETFFSRTDKRGVIQAANYIFKRVAHYDWAELLEQPHSVVRHPDMPRGVFRTIWKELEQGRPVGGYVKNLSKDGLHYWVFAVMLPFADGYLSGRIKPSCGRLQAIEALYAELRNLEITTKITPKESAQLLTERLQEMGYESYQQFMSQSLADELLSRDKELDRPKDRRTHNFRQMHHLAEKLTEQTQLLIQQFDAMRTIPHNLRVIASRLEPTGGPVSTLSQNYGTMSREMSQWFETHVLGEQSNFSTIKGSVQSAMSMSGMSRILNECADQLQAERRHLGGEVSLEDERRQMTKLVAEYDQRCASCFLDVLHETDRIAKACGVMNRHILGLSTTRVMCKIESARRPDAGDALNDIITQLMSFQNQIKDQLERIARLAADIQQLQC